MEQRQAEGAHIPTHGSRSEERVTVPDWQGGEPTVRVWGGTECGTSAAGRMRKGDGKEVGGYAVDADITAKPLAWVLPRNDWADEDFEGVIWSDEWDVQKGKTAATVRAIR